ncbi:ras and EF-hand domain-containing protein homolog isoform X2 [Dermacentor albipictus]|uniref:ras and EF-hand domain-containing protein homolog isoform X2 n=1 Tax=Dermacentor albipictus TaxID=60249 RepID=UPI0031FBD423
MATLQLEQLFRACDTRGTGYLDREELRKLCHRFSISSQDADAIFEDLDHDDDGRIDFHDFEKGFRDFLTQLPGGDTPPESETADDAAAGGSSGANARAPRPSELQKALRRASTIEYRRDSVINGGDENAKLWNTQRAWGNLTTELAKSGNVINEETLNDLYKELQRSEKPQVVERFEDVIADLLDNMKRLQEENSQLENTWLKEKKEHEEHLRRMEEEMDNQVKLVELQAKAKVEEEVEAKRRTLQAKMSEEMNELQSHVSLFEKVEQWLRANETHDRKLTSVHSKLDEALQENRQLRLSLMDTQNNVALTRSELAQIRSQYEDKCKALYDERERIMGVLQEQGLASKQLQHLQEANRKLQDTNDILRSVLEKAEAEKTHTPDLVRQESVLSDYFGDAAFMPPMRNRRPLGDRRPLFDPEEEERASAIWSTRAPSVDQHPVLDRIESEDEPHVVDHNHHGDQEELHSLERQHPKPQPKESGDEAAAMMAAAGHLQPPAAATATALAEEADSGLSTLRSAAALDSAEEGRQTDYSTPLPSLSSETVSLRNRSLSSATPSLHDHEDSLDSNPAAGLATASTTTTCGSGHSNGSVLTSRPPLPVRSTSKASDRSVQSLPPSFGESASKASSSSSGNGMETSAPGACASISSESGIGSRNTWCSMESIDDSPKPMTRGNLSSRRISEIKRQLGVDPSTAKYHRRAPSPSGSCQSVNIAPSPSALKTRRQRSLSPQRSGVPPVPLPRSRVTSPEPKPVPRRHLSRQETPVKSTDEPDQDKPLDDGFVEDRRRSSVAQMKVSDQETRCSRRISSGSTCSADRSIGSFTDCTGPPEHTFRVVFVGDAAVGKSSFIMRLSRGIFMPQLTSTLGVDFQTKNICIDNKNVSLQLWDTAGQERFRCITQSYFRKADGVMLMYDCTNEQSFLNVRQWMSDLEEVASRGIPIMLVSNKTDLRDIFKMQSKSVVERENGEKIAQEMKAIFVETSAKDGSNINEAVGALTRSMIKHAVPHEKDSLTLNDKQGKSFAAKCCNK